MSISPAPNGAPHRYHDLDALRSFLMIWGIAVHTSTLGISPFLRDVARASGFFRMEAFMTISGLLTALLVARYGATATLRKRLISLLVPLTAGLVLLNPLANYLAYCFHNGWIDFGAYLSGNTLAAPQGPMVWHLHLWFLISLTVYALATPVLSRMVESHLTAFRSLIQDASSQTRFVLLCTVVPVSCLLWRLLFEIVLEPRVDQSFLFLTRVTFYYLPFFGMGVALFRSPLLMDAFCRVRWGHLALAGGLVALSHFVFSTIPKPLAETARLVSEAYLAVTLTGTLFAIARRFLAQERAWVTTLADASYSIYLLHFVVIYLAAIAFRPWLGDSPALVITVMLVTFVTTLLIHQLVIRRIPVLRFLLNGRMPTRRSAAFAPVAVPSASAAIQPPA